MNWETILQDSGAYITASVIGPLLAMFINQQKKVAEERARGVAMRLGQELPPRTRGRVWRRRNFLIAFPVTFVAWYVWPLRQTFDGIPDANGIVIAGVAAIIAGYAPQAIYDALIWILDALSGLPVIGEAFGKLSAGLEQKKYYPADVGTERAGEEITVLSGTHVAYRGKEKRHYEDGTTWSGPERRSQGAVEVRDGIVEQGDD